MEQRERVLIVSVQTTQTDEDFAYANQELAQLVDTAMGEVVATVTQKRESISGIGYKEWIPYFEGEQSREAIIATIQQNSRRYAKRQLTWFRNRLPQIRWVNLLENPKDKEELLEELSAFVEEG